MWYGTWPDYEASRDPTEEQIETMASYKIQNVSEVYKIWFNCYFKKINTEWSTACECCISKFRKETPPFKNIFLFP